MSREKDTIASSDEHNSRGIELADRGWLEEAQKEFKKAIELDPNSAHAYENLATVHAEKKEFVEALRAYLRSLELEPESATGHYNLACFLSQYALDFAISEYREAIELEPDSPDSHLNLGLTLADAGAMEDATKELQRAIELDPTDPFAHQELAGLLMDEGDYRAAITQLKEVTRLDAKNFDGWLDLGVCYAQKGFYAEAERAYLTGKELKPDDLLLTYNMAALYAQWGRKADALTHLKAALGLDREEVLGWLKADPMFRALEGDAEFEALR
ncbi:MAG: tetratricopeptide repeat protein [Myxococcaceae bacterium]